MRNGKLPVFAIIILGALCLSLIHCSKSVDLDDVAYSFTGIVRDSATGLPIDSAWIREGDSLSEFIAYTDSTGFYRYMSPHFNAHSVTAFCGKTGYETKSVSFYLNIDKGNIDFELTQ